MDEYIQKLEATGDYRIIYRLKEGEIEILVVAIGHRRDVYERIRRGR